MEQLTDNNNSQDADFQSKPKLLSFSGIATRLVDRFKRRRSFKEKVSQLTVSQWFYIVASLLFFFGYEANYDSEGLVVVGAIAGIGLFRELWQLFMRVWDKMLGKGLLLIFYAATANFALAIAALKINSIAGVEPTPFIFTLGFTTLLMLPFWLTMATALFFSVALVALNIWLLVSVVLRLIRIKIQVHWEDKSFVFVTMIMRLFLIPTVIMTLGSIITPYANQIELFDGPFKMFSPQNITDEQLRQLQEPDKDTALAIIEQLDAQNAADDESQEGVDGKPTRHLDRLVATFIFWFETYPYSACIKEENQRSLVIDENSMLVVERDESELGFKFSVMPCIPVYTSQEEKVIEVEVPNP